MNLVAYIIYFAIMGFIIGRVGWLFYHYGQVYVDRLFKRDLELAKWINKLLLIAYYLFNLGYVALSIQTWSVISAPMGLIERLSSEIGVIVMLLAGLHYINLSWLRWYSQWKAKQEKSYYRIQSKPRNHGSE